MRSAVRSASSSRLGRSMTSPRRPPCSNGQSGDAVLADKAYDSNALRAIIAEIGATAVIPSNRTRKIIIPHDDRRLQTAQPHRALLQPAQTLPTLGNPL